VKPDAPDLDLKQAARAVAAAGSSSCPGEERILAFYAGSLSARDEDALRDHLATCAACVELGQDARRFLAAMGETGPGDAHRAPARPRRWLLPLAASLTLLAAGIWRGSVLWPRKPGPLSQGAAPSPAPPPPAPGTAWRDLVIEKAGYTVPAADDIVWRDGSEGPAPFVTAMEPYARDDFRGAEQRLGAYLAQWPRDDRARFYRGVSLLLVQQPADAIPLLEAAAQAGGALGPEARWYLALAHLKAGDGAAALAELRAVEQTSAARRSQARALVARLSAER
jgi:hypothetical protein